MLLGSLGAEVRLAFAGGEALEACQGYEPSLVLLDIGMPGMDGYEVARRLRQQGGASASRILAVTGYGADAADIPPEIGVAADLAAVVRSITGR